MGKQRCLLLNNSYEILNFITFERSMKLIINDKVDVIDTWDNVISWSNGSMKQPATLRLKRYIKFTNRKIKFNRRAIFRRDSYTCLYCGIGLSLSEATIDHVVPRKRIDNPNSWTNCVTSCDQCNRKKRDRTPDEAGMVLLQIPTAPLNYLYSDYVFLNPKHEAWKNYFE